MWRNDFSNQRFQFYSRIEGIAGIRPMGQARQYLFAPLGLRAKQRQVFFQLLSCWLGQLQLARNERNCSQWGTQFMRRRRRKPIQGRKSLFARQHHFRGFQCIGHAAGFISNAPSVYRYKAQPQKQRGPNARLVDLRQHQRRVRTPRERPMKNAQHCHT